MKILNSQFNENQIVVHFGDIHDKEWSMTVLIIYDDVVAKVIVKETLEDDRNFKIETQSIGNFLALLMFDPDDISDPDLRHQFQNVFPVISIK